MRSCLLAVATLSLCAADPAPAPAGQPAAVEIAVDLVASRARDLRNEGRLELARQLDRLGLLMRSGEVSLADAAAIVQLLPPPAASAAAPRTEAPPASPAQVQAAVNHAIALLDAEPPAKGAPAAASATAAAQLPPASRVLATIPGDDGRTSLVALDAVPGLEVGQRFAILRRGVTQCLVRVESITKGLAKCIVIPGTWVNGAASVTEKDEAVLAR